MVGHDRLENYKSKFRSTIVNAGGVGRVAQETGISRIRLDHIQQYPGNAKLTDIHRVANVVGIKAQDFFRE